jgi:molybdopterin-containing oxidoreductase family membrane subunit
VATLIIIMRKMFRLQHLITDNHQELMNKIIIVTSMMVGYAYAMEFFMAWYSGNMYEGFTFINRAFGPYAWAYWIMVSCNVLSPQIFWFKKIRRNLTVVFIMSLFVNVGMWFERFVITVTSLNRDFLPSSWHYFTPTWVDICTLIGSFGLFFTLFMLFCRFLPQVAISEVKNVLPQAHPHHDAH